MKLFFLVYYTVLITIVMVIFLIGVIRYYLDSIADKKREQEKELEKSYAEIKKEFAEIRNTVRHIQCELLAAELSKSAMNKLRPQEADKES